MSRFSAPLSSKASDAIVLAEKAQAAGGLSSRQVTLCKGPYSNSYSCSRTGSCTSLIAQSASGQIWHARNLDWNLPPQEQE